MISLPELIGETAVFGLGLSGLACVDALCAAGMDVVAWDDNADQCAEASARGAKIRNLLENFGHPARLIVSPGIPLTHPAPHPIIDLARQAGTDILGDMDLFQAGLAKIRMKARMADTDHAICVIGVTGTNGKSTTTALIAHMLAENSWATHTGGNIGCPVLHLPMQKAGQKTAYVLELSSYQLDLNRTLICDVGVLTNLTPDHLDRHGDIAGYIAAKQRLFADDKMVRAARLAVFGSDDADSRRMADVLANRWAEKGKEKEKGRVLLRVAFTHSAADIYFDAGHLLRAGPQHGTRCIDLTQSPALAGPHNGQNAAAALAVGSTLGLSDDQVQAAFNSFTGLAHRLQPVARHGALTFVNDSKATNSAATRHALAAYANIYWIAGGRAKQGGLSGLEASMKQLRHAYLIGEAANAFAHQLACMAPTLACTRVDSLHHAVVQAADQALADQNMADQYAPATILLSPACASLDQFADFEARGEAFCAAIVEWQGHQKEAAV